MKKNFSIPVEWLSYGWIDIEAESKEEALKIFIETRDNITLPTDWDYADDRLRIRCDEGDELTVIEEG